MSRPRLHGTVTAARLTVDDADPAKATIDVRLRDGADEPIVTMPVPIEQLRRYPVGARVVLELRPVRKGE